METVMSSILPTEFITFAHDLADAAGKIARTHFRKPLPVEIKSDLSPVTAADREIERTLRELIAKRYPGHGIFGEEFPPENTDAEFVWVIDPIDGTKSFITGRPMFGTLIALLQHGVPALGVVDHPAIGDRWTGATGHPTAHEGEPVRVRTCPSLSHASVLTSSPDYFKGVDAQAFARLKDRTALVMYGSECMDYGLVASGHADIAIGAGLDPFDYLAAVPVIEGAGGRISDWEGKPLRLTSGHKILATGDPQLHEVVLDLLASDSAPVSGARSAVPPSRSPQQ